MTFTPSLENPPLQAILWERDGDPWRVAVACMLLNATRRDQVDAVWPALFDRWPRAGSLAVAHYGDLAELLTPLGLGDQRAGRLRAMSRAWWIDYSWGQSDRRAGHSSPLDVTHLPGLGRYAQDSHDLFVRGSAAPVAWRATDRVVRAWAAIMLGAELSLCPTCRRWGTPEGGLPMTDGTRTCDACVLTAAA